MKNYRIQIENIQYKCYAVQMKKIKYCKVWHVTDRACKFHLVTENKSKNCFTEIYKYKKPVLHSCRDVTSCKWRHRIQRARHPVLDWYQSFIIIGLMIINTVAWLPNHKAWTWGVPSDFVWINAFVRGVKHYIWFSVKNLLILFVWTLSNMIENTSLRFLYIIPENGLENRIFGWSTETDQI